jgi:hypothetical protein
VIPGRGECGGAVDAVVVNTAAGAYHTRRSGDTAVVHRCVQSRCNK